jgi:hypothetical protein
LSTTARKGRANVMAMSVALLDLIWVQRLDLLGQRWANEPANDDGHQPG